MAVKFSGPLFNAPKQTIDRATLRALKQVGAQIEATVHLKTPRDTGEFNRHIRTKIWRNGHGLTVSAASYEGPKIRTWLETGRRGNTFTGGTVVRLKKGSYMFRAGKTKAKSIDYQAIVGREITVDLIG